MVFSLNPNAGQPLYLQLMEQIRHAIETGVLQHGDLMPGIRTLAEQLVISHNTIAKSYTELEREGFLDLRHGSGAYVNAPHRVSVRAERVRTAKNRVRDVVEKLQRDGLTSEEIRRLFEAELRYAGEKK
jgi:GntR family transcriptional regulator